jgi:inner membrane protein
MDPLAHTLVGASLAQTGLRRLTPLATVTMVIGANLPDVDAITYAINQDLSLGVRRGWTHGLVAMAVWPFLLSAAVYSVHRFRIRHIQRRGTSASLAPESLTASFAPILLLSTIAVLSHPALDWLNSYGIRLLMPLSGRWFYGDTLFIVDPWLWLLAGIGAIVATPRKPIWTGGWIALGIATTGLVLAGPAVRTPAVASWMGAIATIVVIRLLGGCGPSPRRTAETGLALAMCYIVLMRAGTLRADHLAASWIHANGNGAWEIAALPVALNPFVRDVIARNDDRYRFLRVEWLSGRVLPDGPDAPIGRLTPVARAALESPGVRGLRVWLRFPSYQVVRSEAGYRVFIRDVRFWRPGDHRRSFGSADVELDRSLRPRPTSGVLQRSATSTTGAPQFPSYVLISDQLETRWIRFARTCASPFERSAGLPASSLSSF